MPLTHLNKGAGLHAIRCRVPIKQHPLHVYGIAQHKSLPVARKHAVEGRSAELSIEASNLKEKSLAFAQILLEVQDATVLPQLLLVSPELHRGQHFYAQPVAGCLPLLCVCLHVNYQTLSASAFHSTELCVLTSRPQAVARCPRRQQHTELLSMQC